MSKAAATPFLRAPLTVDYAQNLRIFRTRAGRFAFAVLVIALLGMPLYLDSYWLTVADFAGIWAIAAMSLNLVSGDAGQVSLGQAFFLGVGAYASAFLRDHGWPFLLALLGAGLVAAAASALVGPMTLRLRGLYLAFATVALVFIGQHLFVNLTALTGGAGGRAVSQPVVFGIPLAGTSDFAGYLWTPEMKWFWLIAPISAVVALALRNVQRSRWGRAFRAVRDQDIAAWVTGIPLARTKILAFVVSAFVAGIAGALLGTYMRYITPTYWDLLLSVQILAMIIVGGMGSVLGSYLGAAFIVALPRLVDRLGSGLPFISRGTNAHGGFTVDTFSTLLYGVIIVIFLVVEPAGMAGMWAKSLRYLRTWPYKY